MCCVCLFLAFDFLFVNSLCIWQNSDQNNIVMLNYNYHHSFLNNLYVDQCQFSDLYNVEPSIFRYYCSYHHHPVQHPTIICFVNGHSCSRNWALNRLQSFVYNTINQGRIMKHIKWLFIMELFRSGHISMMADRRNWCEIILCSIGGGRLKLPA
jgi:hypothetical protein